METGNAVAAVLVALVALAAPSGVSLARAATLYYLPDARMVELAEAVAVGRVLLVSTRSDPASRRVTTRARVGVYEYVKAPAGSPPEIDVVTVGGHAAGLATLRPGAPRFRPGEKVLLFLCPGGDGTGTWRVLAMARGKYHVDREAGSGLETVRLDLDGLTQIDPATGRVVPADLIPAATGTVYLDDMVATLRRSLRR
jgi:hypothetical protein